MAKVLTTLLHTFISTPPIGRDDDPFPHKITNQKFNGLKSNIRNTIWNEVNLLKKSQEIIVNVFATLLDG